MNACYYYSTFISIFIIFFTSTNTESLYDESGPIQVLNASSFKTYVYRNDKGYLLEYYSFTCPHCKTFAPTYVQVGHIVKSKATILLCRKNVQVLKLLTFADWDNVIGIGAINCVDRDNYDLCRNSNLVGYPTCKVNVYEILHECFCFLRFFVFFYFSISVQVLRRLMMPRLLITFREM